MSTEVVSVGIIGAGRNTRKKHLPRLQAIDGVQVVGVCNRSREPSQRVADEFGIPKVYGSWLEAIEDPDTNAIVIGTWPYMHCRASVAALDADKHVMTEARMARTALEAHTMLEASQANPHLVAQVVPSPSTLEVDQTITRMLSEGYLGEILAIEQHGPAEFLDRDSPLLWRQDFDLSGYNIQALGITYEAIMRWVGEATLVTARGRTFVKARRDDDGRLRPVRIPEHLDVVADMACGAQLHLQQSTVTALLEGGGIYLFGSEGVLRFHKGRLLAARKGEDELREVEIPASERGGWRVEEEFINAIRGEERISHTTFEDGVKYMEFSEAVSRSMATDRAVPLPLGLGS